MANADMHNSPEVVDRPGAWREIRDPRLEDPVTLWAENDALKAELAPMKASVSSRSKL